MKEILRKKIGNKVKEYRNHIELTQDSFAEKLGLTKETISKIERGITSLTDDVLSNIISTFNVKAAYFYTFENAQFSDSKTEKIEAISENLKNFDDNELILINEMINSLKKYNERKNA